MAKTTISELRMEPAKNGVILSYCERKEKPATSKNTYDNCTYDYPKEVFDFEEGASDPEGSAIEKAFGRFKELWMKQYTETKASKGY